MRARTTIKVESPRNSECGSERMSRLDFSTWWLDPGIGGGPYLKVAGPDDTVHRVFCRRRTCGVCMVDGVLCWRLLTPAVADSVEFAQHEIKASRSQKPAYYAWVYWWLVPLARERGYALTLHGSMSRDLDVVAVPWTDQAVTGEELINALASYVPGWRRTDVTAKPHGRMAYQILLGGGAYVDVSVMPRSIAR